MNLFPAVGKLALILHNLYLTRLCKIVSFQQLQQQRRAIEIRYPTARRRALNRHSNTNFQEIDSTLSGATSISSSTKNGSSETATSAKAAYAGAPGGGMSLLCFMPAAIGLVNLQAKSDPGINWAWLALPALLGMLLITLRRRRDH
jgi:hypothetical protein